MTSPNILTDTAALARNRSRAQADALFLQQAAADEVQDRLDMINRAFTSPAVVTPFPELWGARLPEAKILRDNDTLPLEQGAHDLVVHALGLHWANDPVGQLIQCRRALAPDGLLMAFALGGQTLHELRSCLGQAEVAVAGGLSPRVAPMGEVRDLGALLQRAGLALPVADTLPLRVEYRSAWALMRDLRAMGEGNAMTARSRTPTRRAVFEMATDLYQRHFAAAEGRVVATFELITLTGWAPDASQPKPLRPGSAQQRLADALETRETPLSD